MFIYKAKSNPETSYVTKLRTNLDYTTRANIPIIENKQIEGNNNNVPFRRNGTSSKCDRLVMRQSKEISEATFYIVRKERTKLFIKKYYHIH